MMTELIIALLAHMPENRIVQGGLAKIIICTSHQRVRSITKDNYSCGIRSRGKGEILDFSRNTPRSHLNSNDSLDPFMHNYDLVK